MRWLSESGGASLVEFALILSLFAMLVYGGFRYVAVTGATTYKNSATAQQANATTAMPAVGLPNSYPTP